MDVRFEVFLRLLSLQTNDNVCRDDLFKIKFEGWVLSKVEKCVLSVVSVSK